MVKRASRWLVLPLTLGIFVSLGHALAGTTIVSQVCATPPATTIDTPIDQTVTTDNPLTVSGHAEAGATFTILANGAGVGSGSVPHSGLYSQAVSLPLGTDQLQVKVDDSCGDEINSSVVTVIINSPPPAASVLQPTAPSQTTANTELIATTTPDSNQLPTLITPAGTSLGHGKPSVLAPGPDNVQSGGSSLFGLSPRTIATILTATVIAIPLAIIAYMRLLLPGRHHRHDQTQPVRH